MPGSDLRQPESHLEMNLEQVSVRFDNHPPVLSGINLTLRGGEFTSIIGPSGCGKTTILRLAAGLVTPSAGQVRANRQGRIAFVFQDPNLLPWRSVTDNIRLPLELLQTPRDRWQKAIRQSLDMIGLRANDEQKYPGMLSGGMKMRVSLARALVTQPELLLLDEPFAALDDMLRQQLNEDLLRVWGEQRWAALFVTHNVSEAVFLSERVIVMHAHPGRIVEAIEVPFKYPRRASLRGEPEFARLTASISQQLRGEIA